MKTIELTQGKVALVDDADYERLSQFKWCADKTRNGWRAVRNSLPDDAGKRKLILMHYFLMGGRTDHISGNGLNNQRSNLRLATNTQNTQAFQTKRARCSSKFRGVSWFRRDQNWRATLGVNYKQMHIGYFSCEIEAARVRDAAALKFFGSHAQLNFP